MKVFAILNPDGTPNGFYPEDIWPEDRRPEEAIEISWDHYQEFLGNPGERKLVNGKMQEFTPPPVKMSYQEAREIAYNNEVRIEDQLDAIRKQFSASKIPLIPELDEVLNKVDAIKARYPKE